MDGLCKEKIAKLECHLAAELAASSAITEPELPGFNTFNRGTRAIMGLWKIKLARTCWDQQLDAKY